VVGVEQWAKIRRMHRVERLSIREIGRRTGLHRKTVRRALAAETPPRYSRPAAASKLDPFRDWVCEQLRADPTIQSLRLREMAAELGYEGGKTIFDDFVREVRPRFQVRRTSQRTVYRRGSWCSAICGNRVAQCRSVTARPGAGGSSPRSCVGRG
jgi:transposase